MKQTSPILLVAMLVSIILSGCGSSQWTPEAKQLAYRDTFNSTVNTLATAIDAGVFTSDESQHILEYAGLGQQILDRIDAAIELEQPTSELIHQFNLVLRELVAYRKAAERKTVTPTQGGTIHGTD